MKEVNRGRVIHVEGVMTPAADAAPSHATVPVGTTLEAAAEVLSRVPEDAINVLDASGRRAGRISLRQIVGAMVTPQEASSPPAPSPTGTVQAPGLADDGVPPLEAIGRSVLRAQTG